METDRFYHVFNRANGFEKLFLNADNYNFFLRQFDKYISPIAELYAYCLMSNHFHFVLRIKSEKELLGFFEPSKGFKPLEGSKPLERLISLQFGHFFNSYSQAFNKMHGRMGSLFIPKFKRKEITDENYLRQVILYVHLNPYLHKVSKSFANFPYSSYSLIINSKWELKNQVIELFGDRKNFIFCHQERMLTEDLLSDIIQEDV